MIVYRRTGSRCRPTPAEREEADGRGRADELAAHHLLGGRVTTSRSRSWSSTRTASRTAPAGSRRLEADTVILALGQEADPGSCARSPGCGSTDDVVRVDPGTLMTDVPGIFAGGDTVPTERTVTIGVGHGKRPHGSIDAWLANRPVVDGRRSTRSPRSTSSTSGTSAITVRDHPARARARVPRSTDFDEIVGRAVTAEQAHVEAERCLSCGNCFECDGCLGACPEDAIIKLGKGHALPLSTTRSAPAARRVTSSARCTPSR